MHSTTHYTHLRTSLRQKRQQLTEPDKSKATNQIITQLIQQPKLKQSTKIAGYLSIDGEVDLSPWFAKAWQQSKQCYLPVVKEKQLLFAPYTQTTLLKPNRWGILEPTTPHFILPTELEAVLLPLVAFDSQGNRLGRGAGYYDRSFEFVNKLPANQKPYLVGIAYAFQKVSSLIPNPWDVPMHTVITELENASNN